MQAQLARVDIVIEFLASEVDFLNLHISNVQKSYVDSTGSGNT